MSSQAAGRPTSWDAGLYDDKHAFVWQYGAGVVELLAAQPGERILDVGCGTGHLTAGLAEAGAVPLGFDSAASMIEQARRLHPGVRFEVADATDFDFGHDFDAVFSNAALHWVRPPERAVDCIWRALRPGGRLVAEMGGRGNVARVSGALLAARAAAGHAGGPELLPWYFPSIGQYAGLLEAYGFDVVMAALIDRPTRLEAGEAGLRQWYTMFAGSMLDDLPAAEQAAIMADAEARLRPALFADGVWTADYRRLRLVARKPAQP